MSGFGVFLAIATAFSWALGCVVHTTASRVVGIPAVMLIRQPLASVVLGIFCLVMGDLWLPSLHLFWLAAASGVFGIIIGDACQYAGALTIGLRPAQVCQSLSSCFTALFGSIYLNEYIGLQGWLGMFVATCGVILVVLSEQRDAHNPPVSSKQRNKGVIISLLAAVFVALGIVFSKQALQEGIGALHSGFLPQRHFHCGHLGGRPRLRSHPPGVRKPQGQPRHPRFSRSAAFFEFRRGIWLRASPRLSSRRRRRNAHRASTHRPAYHHRHHGTPHTRPQLHHRLHHSLHRGGNPAAPITQKEAPSSADSVKTAFQGAPLQQRGTFFRALRQSVHAFQRHSRLETCSLPHTS
ncbi:MAG: DMT family transporter [Bilophila wadsworthia]